jgi:hypothetical protein
MYQRIRALLALVSARFDYNSSVSTHMPTGLWVAVQYTDTIAIDSSIADIAPVHLLTRSSYGWECTGLSAWYF